MLHLLKKRRNDRGNRQSDVPFLAVDVRVYGHPLRFYAQFDRHFAKEARLVNAQTDRNGPPIVTVGLPVSGNDGSSSDLPAILKVQKVEVVQSTEILVGTAAVTSLCIGKPLLV